MHMIIRVTANEIRSKFSEMINTVVFDNNTVIITRFGKPHAVLLGYQEYERLMNPKTRFSQNEWDNGFSAIDTIRAKAKNVQTQQIAQNVATAVREVRKKQ
jgi:prevent-host-death family protein